MKKSIFVTIFLCLVCVGIFGVVLLKISGITDAALATDNGTSTINTNTQVDNGENNINNNNDSINVTDDEENQDQEIENNLEENNENDPSYIDINENSTHINKDEIIEIVGEDVYNFEEGITTSIINPSTLYVLVNKKNELANDYIPNDLVVANVAFSFDGFDEKKQLRSEAASALEQLFEAASQEGLSLVAISGYRSYERQESIYQYNVDNMGEEAANKVSAKPGQSEHQTGLAMDISCQFIGYSLEESFGETSEGMWLAEHAYEYGFIIRYQKNKTEITGYNYEPWHVRYVGKELASYIYTNDITLDQLYEQIQ